MGGRQVGWEDVRVQWDDTPWDGGAHPAALDTLMALWGLVDVEGVENRLAATFAEPCSGPNHDATLDLIARLAAQVDAVRGTDLARFVPEDRRREASVRLGTAVVSSVSDLGNGDCVVMLDGLGDEAVMALVRQGRSLLPDERNLQTLFEAGARAAFEAAVAARRAEEP